jgi:predicted alpha/beta hydrolase family esterase
VAAWAAHSQHVQRVRAALLVAPPDTQREDLPPQLHSWRQAVRQRLPFAATLVYSDDDPFGAAEAATRLAADWGASAVALGACGHINGDSGLGDWPEGLRLLQALEQRAGLA